MSKVLSNSPDRRRVDTRPILAAIVQAMRLPGLWLTRVQLRHELRKLDADQMRDVGLNPVAVQRECVKPFWRA